MSNYEKYDALSVSTLAEIDNIFEWKENNDELVFNFKPVLNEGIFICRNEIMLYFRFNSNDDASMTIIDNNIDIASFTWNRLSGDFNNITIHRQDIVDKTIALEIKRNAEYIYSEELYCNSMFIIIPTIMAYIAHFQSDKQYVQSIRQQVKGSQKKKKGNKVAYIKKIIKVYIGQQLSTNTTRLEKQRSIMLDSWSVRGHIRHLKNGKTTWIKPHKKGAGQHNPKTYKVEE